MINEVCKEGVEFLGKVLYNLLKLQMKIYFVASPRLVVKEPELYRRIHHYLAKDNMMLSDKLISWTDKKSLEDVYDESSKKVSEGYKQAIEAVKKADVVMLEVSGHSISMGYLVSKAMDLSKPVVALCKKGTKSIFLGGINDRKFKLLEYSDENINEILDLALEEAKKSIDIRFNFFVPPSILSYLDWVSQNRRQPKSVFLRELIEKEMRKDKAFKQ